MTLKLLGAMLAATIAVAAFPVVPQVPIEHDAIVGEPRGQHLPLVKPAVKMIRAMGWRCDSISSVQRHLFSRGFTVVYNRFAYEYEFKDRGGRWVVILK